MKIIPMTYQFQITSNSSESFRKTLKAFKKISEYFQKGKFVIPKMFESIQLNSEKKLNESEVFPK